MTFVRHITRSAAHGKIHDDQESKIAAHRSLIPGIRSKEHDSFRLAGS
jgi:hypothetical protein